MTYNAVTLLVKILSCAIRQNQLSYIHHTRKLLNV